RLLAAGNAVYPQFATHNAHTLAAVLEFAGGSADWEFQRLHGMGEALYEQVVGADKLDRPCRVYAPVGGHEDLLAYLVRRLLENGANTSFVNRIVDEREPIDEIAADPSDRRRRSGGVAAAGAEAIEPALARAARAAPSWSQIPAETRAAILDRAADLYEGDRAGLMALIIREGGRTIPAALSEVREAADFLRYYAARARADFAAPERLPGPTGERNEIALHGRGELACISPWNF